METYNRLAVRWEVWDSFNKNLGNGYTFAVQKSQNAAFYLFLFQPLVFKYTRGKVKTTVFGSDQWTGETPSFMEFFF